MLKTEFFRIYFLVTALFVCSTRSHGTEISYISESGQDLKAGDIIVLDARTDKDYAKIQWWREGKLECDQAKCVIDTTNFKAGKYVYHVLATGTDELAYSTVSLSVTPSEPLYVPARHTSKLISPNAQQSFSVGMKDWQIFVRKGQVTFESTSNTENPGEIDKITTRTGEISRQINFAAKPRNEIIYRVPHGSQAIIRKPALGEEWLVDENSTFRFVNYTFELVSGQAIWRKIHDLNAVVSPNVTQATSLIAGATVTAKGSWFVEAIIGFDSSTKPKATIKNIESGSLEISCPNTAIVPVNISKSKVIQLSAKGICEIIDPDSYTLGNLSSIINKWHPWWSIKLSQTQSNKLDILPLDSMRVEHHLTQGMKSENELLAFANAGKQKGFCADVLDYLGSSSKAYSGNSKILSMIGECQLALRIFSESLATGKLLELSQYNPSQSAFMLGASLQGLDNHRAALPWFLLAEKRNFADKVLLARAAVRSAELSDNPREKLRWQEILALEETDRDQRAKYKESAERWRQIRARGAILTGSLYMDSQAIPVNSKKISTEQVPAMSSRSATVRVDANWWQTFPLTQDSAVNIEGIHDYIHPLTSGMIIGVRSIHDARIGLTWGEAFSDKPESISADASNRNRWSINLSAVVGTGISGGERQRDHLGTSITFYNPNWSHFRFGINSDKYLDPRPGGKDVIDLDLDRYAGEADHSHIDMILWAGFTRVFGTVHLQSRIYYGQVNFRTGILDEWDHVLTKVDLTFKHQFNHYVDIVARPVYLSRTYRGDHSHDQTSQLRSHVEFHNDGLWRASVFANLEQRATNGDDVTSWSRHQYGVSLIHDL